MTGTEENKCSEHNYITAQLRLNNYEKKYYFYMLLIKIIGAIYTGAAAIITLGEPSLENDYKWNFITICMATITVIYASMFNTPEKLKNASKALENNKILAFLAFLAIITVFLVIYFTRKFPLPIAVSAYFAFNLFFVYFVTVLDKYFSKE